MTDEKTKKDFFELLRFASVGADPLRLRDCIQCAVWLRKWLEERGFEAELLSPGVKDGKAAPPILPNFFSGRLAEPATREKKMIGMTIIFSIEMRIVPKGVTNPIIFPAQAALPFSPRWKTAMPPTMPAAKAIPIRHARGMEQYPVKIFLNISFLLPFLCE